MELKYLFKDILYSLTDTQFWIWSIPCWKLVHIYAFSNQVTYIDHFTLKIL